jgi:hypothetical protein
MISRHKSFEGPMAVQIVRHQVSNCLRTEETDYESGGQEFESLRARQLSPSPVVDFQNGLKCAQTKFAFSLGFSLGKFFAVELRPLPLRSGLEARPLPIRLRLLGELKPGRRPAVKAEAAKRGATEQPLRPDAGPVHCRRQQSTRGLIRPHRTRVSGAMRRDRRSSG